MLAVLRTMSDWQQTQLRTRGGGGGGAEGVPPEEFSGVI